MTTDLETPLTILEQKMSELRTELQILKEKNKESKQLRTALNKTRETFFMYAALTEVNNFEPL